MRLNHKELSDEKVLLLTKKKYGFMVHFLQRFIKLISDESLILAC